MVHFVWSSQLYRIGTTIAPILWIKKLRLELNYKERIYVYITDSLYCTAETDTALYFNKINFKNILIFYKNMGRPCEDR